MSTTSTAEPRSSETPPRGPHAVAVVAAVFTWPLIFVGGLVTTYRVGMAVPDWPTTFGMNMFLFRFWEAAWGVFIEHGHRLYGAAVGLATLILAVWFVAADRRASMKALGVFALVAVIGQGVLGGYRVRLNSTALAAVHGATAQAFFALMVALCVLTGRSWSTPSGRAADVERLRRRSAVTLAMIYLQVVIGAWLRHFGTGTGLALHALLATAVWGHAAVLVWRVARQKRDAPELAPAARAMALAVTFQVLLGLAAWWFLLPFDGRARFVTTPQALVRTAHQANGALLLGSAVVLTLRSFRRLSPTPRVGKSATAPLTWEAVA